MRNHTAFRGRGAVMPNIYYCNGLANNDLGILRAVLSWEECKSLLNLFSVQYAGFQFPAMTQRDQGFAVLNLLKGELDDKWRVGFYSFDADRPSANRRMGTNLRCVSKPYTRSKTRVL